MMSHVTCWRLSTVDTWFFREARAHDAVGVSELGSLFPPATSTLMGAVRTHVGDAMGIDWSLFAQGKGDPRWAELLGQGARLGQLRLQYMQLMLGDLALHATPANLLCSPGEQDARLHRLRIGTPVECDLGFVNLPEMQDGTPPGSKPATETWITRSGLEAWLRGERPLASTLRNRSDLFTEEPRLGIGRDNARATVQTGLLYQTRHLRPKPDSELGIALYLEGLPDTEMLSGTGTLRLGGEGRPARVHIARAELTLPSAPTPDAETRGLILLLDSPTDPGQSLADGAPLPGFRPVTDSLGRVTGWEGALNGVGLRIRSQCQERPLRQGGWDQQKHEPRGVRSLLRPGSLLYCELTDAGQSLASAIHALHGIQIGQGPEWGQGRVLTGLWQRHEYSPLTHHH